MPTEPYAQSYLIFLRKAICIDDWQYNTMKKCYLQIGISDDQMRQLEEEAMRRGMTKSELIRHLIAKFPEPKDGG